MTFGTCRYCGQVVNLDYEEETQAEADIAASEKCECYDARHERNLRKQITAAQNRIRKIFGDDAAKLGFSPIAAEEPLQASTSAFKVIPSLNAFLYWSSLIFKFLPILIKIKFYY